MEGRGGGHGEVLGIGWMARFVDWSLRTNSSIECDIWNGSEVDRLKKLLEIY